jgi:hypothetical protein
MITDMSKVGLEIVTVYGSYTVLRPRYTVYGDIHIIPYPDTDVYRLLAHIYIC